MELLAYVNRAGAFIRQFQGIGFDTFALKTNTNDQDLNKRNALFISQIATLQLEYDALIAESKAKTIESLEAAFKSFVAECRVKRKEVADVVGMRGTWESEKVRLANVLNSAKMKLDVARKSKPSLHSFPDDETIAAWEQSVVRAEAAFNDALKNVRQYEVNYSLYAADVARQQQELKQMIEVHDKKYVELQRTKGVSAHSEQSSLGNNFGLIG